MKYAIQWVRSLFFVIQMYVAMMVFGIVFFPFALMGSAGAFKACHSYCVWVRWTAKWMVGLNTEVRGTPPTGQVIVAAKHQSFLDIILIYGAIPRGKFIAKKILKFSPILGQYAWRIGCVFVDRGKRAQAISTMMDDVAKGRKEAGQLVIYPQGTRVAPGDDKPYKMGVAVLYSELGQDCVPVAANVGLFWPKRGIYRKPGTAVVEFLPTIPAGDDPKAFLQKLETVIETHSDRLMAEAGFENPKRNP